MPSCEGMHVLSGWCHDCISHTEKGPCLDCCYGNMDMAMRNASTLGVPFFLNIPLLGEHRI